MLKEMVIENLIELKHAVDAKVDRIEICSDLAHAGTSPSFTFVKQARKVFKGDIFVLVRSNQRSDFIFNSFQTFKMVCQIKIYKLLKVNGFVFGALNENKTIDVRKVKKLLKASKDLPATFHMGFDLIDDKTAALDQIYELGFKRILTKGGQVCALDNIEMLKKLIKASKDKLTIVVGGKVTKDNLGQIDDMLHAKEYHGRLIV